MDFFKHDPYRIVTKDNKIKWVLDSTVTQKNANNEINYFIGYITDITQIKQQEKELQESELKWKFAIEGNGDGLWDWNLQDNTVFFSSEWKKMLGYEEDEIQDSLEEWSKRVHPDQITQVYSDVHAYLDGKTDLYRNEHQVICKNGTYIWVLDRGIVIERDEDNKPLRMIGTHSNIDQQKKVQKELRDSKILAESANKSKSEFLANMSHEIRTPMTGMLGFIERLLKDEKDSERLRQLKVIENSGQTLLAIINDILDFSKIESGKLELESFPLNIQELCQNSADMFLSLTSAKNITLHKLINENLPSCIMGDEIRLKQVIFNLMSNAIKFTINGGSISLQVYFNEETQTIYIAVVDTGVGIAKENLEKIFEAFSQEDVSTTRKFGGTGLGLSISSQLVRLMGSEIKVESKVGEGSKFYFEIPVEICTHESDLIRVDTSEDLTKSRIFNGHILVVEDNKTNQMLMSMILDDLNLTYDIANNGAEATLNFKLKKYDLILMDENMPIMNGIEATKNIRERELDESLTPTPIIAVTANALRGDKEKFIDSGMDDYIPKPYSEDDIVRVLQKYLG